MGGVFCIGRFIFGGLNQIPCLHGGHIWLIGVFCAGCMTLMIPMASSLKHLHILSGLIGLFTACYGCSMLDMAVIYGGVSQVHTSYGGMMVFLAVGQAIGAPLAGEWDWKTLYHMASFLFRLQCALKHIVAWPKRTPFSENGWVTHVVKIEHWYHTITNYNFGK